ncbi:MAG: hypothetical protein ACQEVA_10280 [Myxococcota bacterium]
MNATSQAPDSNVALTPELKEEVRLARRFFTQLERLGTLISGYPPGHPVVENAASNTREALYEYFELNDRLTLQVEAHSMKLSGTEEKVWETEPPKDYCFAMSRDGIYLVHILAGTDNTELRRFIEILNELVDQRDMSTDAASLLFEANFRYIAYEAIDESLAALAGLDMDARNRDTEEERDKIEELFNNAFNEDDNDSPAGSMKQQAADGNNMAENFEIRLEVRQDRQKRLEVGSRQFLDLPEESQKHLWELRKGFIEHNELEHREGEILSAILGAQPKPKLRRESVNQIGEVMGSLLETDEPWEALSFLKLIHAWRDKFADEVSGELKNIVRDCFTIQRVNSLLRQISEADKGPRRAILQMFDALSLEKASRGLVQLLDWDLDEEARNDIVSYLRKRSKYGLDFIEESIEDVSGDAVEPLLEILEAKMPRSRSIMMDLLEKDLEPPVKARILGALRGTWDDPREIRDTLVPMLDSSNRDIQLEAIRAFSVAAPQHVDRVMGPNLQAYFAGRPTEEVREIANLFVEHGGKDAVQRLDGLIRKKGMVSGDEQETAIEVVRSLVNTPSRPVIELLEDIGGDWLVPKKIRNNCKEVAQLLQS